MSLGEIPRRARSRLDSFRHAFAGGWHVLRTQRNAWIHGLITVAVVLAGLWVRLSAMEWAVIAVTTGLVWLAEFINTALEAAVDLASPAPHPLARVAKDVSAAAVLFSALIAVVVGILIPGPPLWKLLFGSHP